MRILENNFTRQFMNHCYKITLLSVLMIIFFSTARAQENRELLLGPMDVFVPHWELGVEAGAGYDVGEDKFANLITPAVQVTAAYHFNEFLAARLAVSGFQSKNLYVFPEEKYKWNFVQPALDLKLDLSSLFLGWVPENTFRPYAYLGAGLNVSFNNDDAVNADKRWGVDFEKLWRDNRLNPVVRGGLGFDWWLNDKIALTGDACANMLPDHYNSKYGKYDNRDWHITAMLGLRFRLGDANKHTEPVWGEPPVVNPQPAKITRDQVDLTVNVQFIINQSIIRDTETGKLQELIYFLQQHPEAHVLLTGYADKDTGTPSINERLSRERADAVANYLSTHGISSYRIHKDHKGDRIQPFDFPPQNRVCICIVLNRRYL